MSSTTDTQTTSTESTTSTSEGSTTGTDTATDSTQETNTDSTESNTSGDATSTSSDTSTETGDSTETGNTTSTSSDTSTETGDTTSTSTGTADTSEADSETEDSSDTGIDPADDLKLDGNILACGLPSQTNGALFHTGQFPPISKISSFGDMVALVIEDPMGRRVESWNLSSSDRVLSLATDRTVHMAGSTLALVSESERALEFWHVVTGTRLGTLELASDSRYGLSVDGGYFWTATSDSITAWSTAGEKLFESSGNYGSGSQVFAAIDELRIAGGPAGEQVIETVSVSGNTVSNVFIGSFQSWFTDGGHFSTIAGDDFERIYSAGGTLVQTLIEALEVDGHGNYYWGADRRLRALGSTDTLLELGAGWVHASHGRVTVYSAYHIQVVDLDGPVAGEIFRYARDDIGAATHLATRADGSWSMVTEYGWLYDSSVSSFVLGRGREGYRGCGTIAALEGARNGQLFVQASNFAITRYDLNAKDSTHEEISNGGWIYSFQVSGTGDTILVAGRDSTTVKQAVLVYEAGALDTPRTITTVDSFGAVMAAMDISDDGAIISYSLQGDTLGSPSLVVESLVDPDKKWFVRQMEKSQVKERAVLSASGDPFAYVHDPIDNWTRTIADWTVLGSVQALPVIWTTDGNLLVEVFDGNTYQESRLVTPAGATISTMDFEDRFTAPREGTLRTYPVDDEHFYVPKYNKVYHLATGAKVWSGTLPSTGIGALVGERVVYLGTDAEMYSERLNIL